MMKLMRLYFLVFIMAVFVNACQSEFQANETQIFLNPLPSNTPPLTKTTNPIKKSSLEPTITLTPTSALAPNSTLSPTLIPTSTEQKVTTSPSSEDTTSGVIIINVNKRDEYVDLRNDGTAPQDLRGWILVSERGNQRCLLSGIIQPGEVLRVWAGTTLEPGFKCGFDQNIWNNSESDPATLYNEKGEEVSRY
ncbi:MAG: lamin tail domain-containing protein [Chloroflexota bacterium]